MSKQAKEIQELEELIDQLKELNVTTPKEDAQLEAIIFKLGTIQIVKSREEQLRDLMYKINHPGNKKSKR
jgi:hypothetical protein